MQFATDAKIKRDGNKMDDLPRVIKQKKKENPDDVVKGNRQQKHRFDKSDFWSADCDENWNGNLMNALFEVITIIKI